MMSQLSSSAPGPPVNFRGLWRWLIYRQAAGQTDAVDAVLGLAAGGFLAMADHVVPDEATVGEDHLVGVEAELA